MDTLHHNMCREVFEKLDEEKVADYGHSKVYQLLPHFSENLEGKKKDAPEN